MLKFLKNPWVAISLWAFAIALIGYDIQSGALKYSWELIHPPVVVAKNVVPMSVQSTPVALGDFEYCKINGDSNNAERGKAGTPVPSEPISIGVAPTPDESVVMPTPAPTESAQDNLKDWAVTTQNVGTWNKANFHVVLVGVGYTKEENAIQAVKFAKSLEEGFAGVSVDFAYVPEPINIAMRHIDTIAVLENPEYFLLVPEKVRSVASADAVLLLVNTNTGLAVSDGHQMSLVSVNDPSAVTFALHETGHLLGLNDGYPSFYGPSYFPNKEIFYADAIPADLAKAISEYGKETPLFRVGTCNGRPLYKFFANRNNVMDTFGPDFWNDHLFTPLQIIEMNDFVRTLRGN